MLHVINDIAIWIEGNSESETDVWFLPGFAESHLCFRDAFKYNISKQVRIILFDPPGLGASPARPGGITIKDCAIIWKDLIDSISKPKKLVLVAHSVAGIIATETAAILDRTPSLIVSVEGNLTAADAYFSGQAVHYSSPFEFYQHFSNSVFNLAKKGDVPMSYYASLQFADPNTLWTLGKSTQDYSEPGNDFQKLECPTVYYWSDETLSSDSKSFLKANDLNNRELDGLGHWPMNKSPKRFYSQLLDDIQIFVT